jgi:hypothetical protein
MDVDHMWSARAGIARPNAWKKPGKINTSD